MSLVSKNQREIRDKWCYCSCTRWAEQVHRRRLARTSWLNCWCNFYVSTHSIYPLIPSAARIMRACLRMCRSDHST